MHIIVEAKHLSTLLEFPISIEKTCFALKMMYISYLLHAIYLFGEIFNVVGDVMHNDIVTMNIDRIMEFFE